MAENKNTNTDPTSRSEKNHKKIVLFAGSFVLAMVVCIVSVLLVAFALVTEGTYEIPEEPVASKTELPVGDDAILKYAASLVNGASDNKLVKFKSNVSVSLSDFVITPEENADKENVLIDYLKGDIQSFVDGLYPEDFNGEFGAEYAERPLLELKIDDIVESACVNGVLDTETGELKLDGDGKPVDADYYNIIFDINTAGAENNAEISKLFSLADEEPVFNTITEKFKDVFVAENGKSVTDTLTVKMRVNRLNDMVDYIELEKSYVVDADIKFNIPELKNNEQHISFIYKIVRKVNFTYAGIAFSQKALTVAPGSSDTKLGVNAVINDNSEYKVKFTSADESILKIDELGYITALHETNDPVKVFVELEYLGNIFTDECEVYIRKPVEKIKISNDELSLNIGETATLTAALKPVDATDKKILWFVEAVEGYKADIVTVDENGNVTANDGGTVKIVAVSDDGHFRDSCVLSVKGGDSE